MRWYMMPAGAVSSILLLLSSVNISPGDLQGDDLNRAEYLYMKRTCEWFERNDIRFGHGWDGELFCTPPYKGSKTEFERQLSDFSTGEYKSGGHAYSFRSYLRTGLSDYFSNTPGDTVLIISEMGFAKAVISHIGYYITTCFEGVRCRLELVDSTENAPTGMFLALLGELADYKSPIEWYSDYKPSDPILTAIEDSLHKELEKVYRSELYAMVKTQNPLADSIELEEIVRSRWDEIESFHKNIPRIHTHYSGIKHSSLPDTLYMFNNSWFAGTEAAWAANYKLTHEENSWRIETIKAPGKSDRGTRRVICTMDLNGDGEVEYLSTGGGSIWLWMFFWGEATYLKGSGYWGC